MGDNANIYRLTDGTNFLTFTCDNYSSTQHIIPRAFEALEYTAGAGSTDVGAGDLILGEAGDDVIHGMSGNDVIFGDGQDDDIYGGNGNDLFPLYLGSPWYLRGLTGNDIVPTLAAGGRDVNELIGSKLLVANAEFRIPFTGPEQLALIKSKLLLSDLNFFIDGGLAFTSLDQFGGPTFTLDQNGEPLINPTTGEPYIASPGVKPIFTAGVSARVNVFGQLVRGLQDRAQLLQEERYSFHRIRY